MKVVEFDQEFVCFHFVFEYGKRMSTYLKCVGLFCVLENLHLISTLVHRALMICTKRTLNEKIELIKKIVLDNGYPKNVINAQIAKKIAEFSTLRRFGPEKRPVYLRVLG